DERGQPTLYYAILKGNKEIIRALAQVENIDINGANKPGNTFLEGAVRKGDPELVNILLENSTIIIDCKDQDGRTPLWHAINKGYLLIVQALLGARADIDIKDNEGKSPFDLGTQLGTLPGMFEIITALCKARAKKNSLKPLSRMPLVPSQPNVGTSSPQEIAAINNSFA